jgi:hypothetical protein
MPLSWWHRLCLCMSVSTVCWRQTLRHRFVLLPSIHGHTSNPILVFQLLASPFLSSMISTKMKIKSGSFSLSWFGCWIKHLLPCRCPPGENCQPGTDTGKASTHYLVYIMIAIVIFLLVLAFLFIIFMHKRYVGSIPLSLLKTVHRIKKRRRREAKTSKKMTMAIMM